ncbi:LTP_2 domain-containing protein [Cephalotus follicularis]|uniref:LTP_2 domain-containing protein n=1 Tax=Cephalotus follicularis TaxID=3775 RepID=A0A1Q3DHQ5_CEPFO|nr:LTP_2 domain-containing protein [Cephalotus follicularis]
MGFLVLTVVSIWSSVDGAKDSQTAPSPPVDCTNLVLSMADCLTYVQNGSIVTTPEGSCCVGLKNVLMIEPECICEVFENSATLGFVLNATKAETLPAVCKISATSISDCGCEFNFFFGFLGFRGNIIFLLMSFFLLRSLFIFWTIMQ